LILKVSQLRLSSFEDFSGAAEIELSGLSNLGQLVCAVVGLSELVISGTDLLALAVILTLSVGVELTETLNLIEILCFFLLKLGDFEEKSIDVFA
jgi:hypothetical protein